ncbi:uncharacterized protein LOC131679030 [Topomyia yanbarensis]|uniref:uncharacterized protein LOC131679030 n=1 Tax=Topomyia yanbarensis TaxID=2498891 RepID=UPI00273B4192|nr:uncharacterized protein LOC131679030 [Topomyia yanbarensis]XP_058815535.1 uncharacterized protein LOC131679030 [Topomyia yanbarensis]XP_058815536.1 uncharacterized protein LOC131679030 [Topomyia yanbarensis]XP_058815537.1 uncharacterized protein LOC131679030 [Topomyia yanbarensis]
MSVDGWCKNSEDNMQDIIVEDDAVRFCRVTTEEGGGGDGTIGSNNPTGHSITMDKDEKRMRREIANSNERRRMQSINAGFQSLRQMLPHHEGEKLSKAAILQQTAEYIYALEQEKTRLLSQNCQLKRLLDQQDHNGAVAAAELQQATTQTVPGATTVLTTATVPAAAAAATATATVANTTVALPPAPPGTVATGGGTNQGQVLVATVAKKRKIDAIMTVQPVSDSSDEGLGSMSPEPVSLMQVVNNATGQTLVATTVNGRACGTFNVSAKDYLDMKHQLEIERRQKAVFEDRLKALERQIYPARVLYQDHPDMSDARETYEEITVSTIQKPMTGKVGKEIENVQLIELDAVVLGKKQLVVCTPEIIEEMMPNPIQKSTIVPIKEEKVFIKRSRSRSPTIETVVTLPPKKNRYPTILEAAIKAEPKVEVERIDSPSSIVVSDDHLSHLSSSKLVTSQQQQAASRINTCRHNLETIVEAIRHLEGDAFDAVVPGGHQQQSQASTAHPRQVQEVPLALTTSSKHQQKERDQRQSQLEPYLKFRTAPPVGTCSPSVTSITSSSAAAATAASSSSNSANNASTISNPAIVSVSITPTISCSSSPSSASAQQTASQILQQHQQSRPGVIVVKQNS